MFLKDEKINYKMVYYICVLVNNQLSEIALEG